MTRLLAAIAALVAGLIVLQARAQHTLDLLEDNGPSDNRIDLVVMGDGYTADEQAHFADDADNALEHLFEKIAFSSYTGHFNLARISTVSNESGADHPSDGEYVDSFFGCAFECFGIDQLICCDDALILDVAAQLYPGFDRILLVVNDHTYGGAGGTIAITSSTIWAMDVPPHEFGHSLAGLMDEYDDPHPSYECQDVFPNVSPTFDPDQLKWMHWVEDGTPLPTPDTTATGDLEPVGAYEGACYETAGWYRPVWSCLMRNLDSDFCPVCAEQLVLSFYGHVEPVDAFGPEGTPIEIGWSDTVELWVEAVTPDPDTIGYTWSLDGTPLAADAGDQLTMLASDLGPGEHQVQVVVQDTTEMVRSDPDGLTAQTLVWTVHVTGGQGQDGSADGASAHASSSGCSCAPVSATRVAPPGLLAALIRVLFV